MTSLTPIRIRGKKTATTAEKWSARRSRKLVEFSMPSGRSANSTSSSSSVVSPKRRKQRQTAQLSRLEQLPTEILQAIFVLSANPDLPLTTPRLASLLNSRHLQYELTSHVLERVTGGRSSSDTELANASRLMNSRFFTWSFFTAWLIDDDHMTDLEPPSLPELDWFQLEPHEGILPPQKLLQGPFTRDKVQFLDAITSGGLGGDGVAIPPLYRELAQQGATQAVAEGSTDALRALLDFGVMPDTELLRLAVVENDCKEEIVDCILKWVISHENQCRHVDLLDIAMWSWAEKARANGNDKGQWLMNRLRAKNRSRLR